MSLFPGYAGMMSRMKDTEARPLEACSCMRHLKTQWHYLCCTVDTLTTGQSVSFYYCSSSVVSCLEATSQFGEVWRIHAQV